MLKHAFIRKFGENNIYDKFISFSTICDATQERQTALREILDYHLERQNPVSVLIVGGLNSSNTGHLLEIALLPKYQSIVNNKAFHIDTENKIGGSTGCQNSIYHKLLHTNEMLLTKNFLDVNRPNIFVVTSGASTPNAEVDKCLQKLINLQNCLKE